MSARGSARLYSFLAIVSSDLIFKIFLKEKSIIHDGNVAMITLPIPWYMPRNNAGFGLPVAEFV